ncbi:small ribosomal subunit Rsm22 family protein [bacterium]|nr:small ribosomal subunit Rsm22 family protein [bacterium]
MTLFPQPTVTERLNKKLPDLIALWRDHFNLPGPRHRLRLQETTAIAKKLRLLSQGLTRERKLAGKNYFSDPYQFGAYLFFFWPVSYAQARFVLDPLVPGFKTILEMGSGAAPLGTAAGDLNAGSVTALDRSSEALFFAKKIIQQQKKKITTTLWHGGTTPASLPGHFDLISFQHVLNELWPKDPAREQSILKLLKSAASHLTPRGQLLLIEPALTETSRCLLRIRNALLDQGFTLAGPCLTQMHCPALSKPSDSCHIDWPWSPPSLTEELARLSGFKKHDLKMTYFLFHKSGPPPQTPLTTGSFLIVSEPMLSKNKRIRFIGCGPAGRLGLALHPKNRAASNALFFTLKRGDHIRIHDYECQENGIRLHQGSGVEVLSRAIK